MWLFYHLRRGIMAFRKQWCRVADHKMEWTGYYEADAVGSGFHKVNQCVRCRFVDRQSNESVCVRFNPKNPYGE
jgi:hypothetical protein